jgi:hypothetical protein
MRAGARLIFERQSWLTLSLSIQAYCQNNRSKSLVAKGTNGRICGEKAYLLAYGKESFTKSLVVRYFSTNICI